MMFTTIKSPISHGRQVRNFSGVFPYLAVLDVLVSNANQTGELGRICENDAYITLYAFGL